MEIENNRRGRLRIGLDSDHRNQGRNDPNRFAETGYDGRHDFHASDVARWDQSETANKARAFARWKDANPSEYREMNNLHGNAETWFHKTGGGKKKKNSNGESLSSVPMIGLAGMLTFGGVSLVTLVPAWLILGLMYTNLGWDIHWTLFGLGAILGVVGALSGVGFILALGFALITSPLILIDLLVKAILYPFRSQAEKDKARARKEHRAQAQRDRAATKAEKRYGKGPRGEARRARQTLRSERRQYKTDGQTRAETREARKNMTPEEIKLDKENRREYRRLVREGDSYFEKSEKRARRRQRQRERKARR